MSTITRPGPVDLALIGLTALIMATAFAAIKVAVAELGPVWTAAARVTFGFFALLPFAVFGGIGFPRKPAVWVLIVMVACLNMVIPFVLISWGLKFIEAGIAALLMGSTPFMALVLSHFFTSDDKINRYKILAVALGLSGLLLVVGVDAVSGAGSAALVAQLAVIAGAGCYVVAGLFMRKLSLKPVSFTILALGAGSVVLIVVALALEGVPQQIPSLKVLLSLLWLGTLPTGLAYLLRFYLIRKVGVSIFAVGMNTVPVFGVLLGAVLLGEVIELRTVAALVLVVSGLVVARMGAPDTQGATGDVK